MKAYPTDERGQLDAGARDALPKPCCARITHENVTRFEASTTWCTQTDGHAGPHAGPLPPVLGVNTFDKGRRRG